MQYIIIHTVLVLLLPTHSLNINQQQQSTSINNNNQSINNNQSTINNNQSSTINQQSTTKQTPTNCVRACGLRFGRTEQVGERAAVAWRWQCYTTTQDRTNHNNNNDNNNNTSFEASVHANQARYLYCRSSTTTSAACIACLVY